MKLLCLCFLFVIISCGSKTAVPKGILPVAQMTEVMWDVLLADGLTAQQYPTDSLKRFDTSAILYQQIAKARGTTQQQLQQSLRFYESRPDLLQIIIDTLQRRAAIPAQAYKRDTTNKADSTRKKYKLFQKSTP